MNLHNVLKPSLKVHCFNIILDQTVSSMETRFQQLKKHNDFFGFMYSFQNFIKLDLKKHATELEKRLNGNSHIDGNMLAE